MYTTIDLSKYPRLKTFEFFKTFEDPFFNITANVDATKLVNFCKASTHSFFLLGLYAATAAANAVPEFGHRLVDSEIRAYKFIHPGSTVLNADETFSFCYFKFLEDWKDFEEKGKEVLHQNLSNSNFDPAHEREDLIYFTSIPWISFTSFKHARIGKPGFGIPRMVFGKYFQQGEKWLMPFSVSGHHALIDGIHVGKFYEQFQKELDQF